MKIFFIPYSLSSKDLPTWHFAYYDEKLELPFDSNETTGAAIFSE